MKIKTKKNNKYETKSSDNKKNGYLIPIYNKKENFFSENGDPQQVYLTVVKTNCIKGPHLHKVRKGFFTCIRGNIRIILKVNNKFIQYYSGEDYEYLSVEIVWSLATGAVFWPNVNMVDSRNNKVYFFFMDSEFFKERIT